MLGLAALLGAAHIGARLTGRERAAFWLKPLPIALFVLIAATAQPPISPLYRSLILAGLLFSMVGDIFLAAGEARFVPGLVAFLIAHLFYTGAFLTQRGLGGPWWLAVVAIAYGVLMLALLWPFVPAALRAPVAIYMAAILVMVWLAAGWWTSDGGHNAGLAALGALSFVASDSTLAWDRFRRPFRLAPLAVMVTYYAAQALLALSV
jgi:uncharacterized membrane protein YhhN